MPRFSSRPSSTVERRSSPLHRFTPGSLGSRADLQSSADPHATYYDAKSRPASARQCRDEELRVEIQRVYNESFDGCYGQLKVWKQLRREGVEVANCTVRRLTKEMGLSGVRRGRHYKVTTKSDDTLHRPSDLATSALEMAIHSRQHRDLSQVIHHSDRGVQGEFNR